MDDKRMAEVLQEMRDESVPGDRLGAAQKRVWERLQDTGSLACDELRPALAGYARGQVGEARRLLIDDHLSRCVECRHALADIKRGSKVAVMPGSGSRHLASWRRWAVAAGVVLAALYIGRGAIDSALAPGGPSATVISVSGTLYQPSGVRLDAGAELRDGQIVRTAAASHAVLRLRDGSEVEMNQRTELGVTGARSGDAIRLERGDIIVAAAEQGDRDLRVITRDSVASVKGTLFAVSSGTAGSLVSVVEGAVEVSRSGYQDLLRAGQQSATSPALLAVGMTEALSWSQEATEYYNLLAELATIEEQLAQSSPASRSEARLVPYLPTNTSAYFAIPNLDGTIADALVLIDGRASVSPTLGEWWSSPEGQEMRSGLEHLQDVNALLGDEMVLVLTGSEEPVPLFMAEVRPGSHEELRRVLQDMATESPEELPYQLTEELLLLSSSLADVAVLSAQLGGGAASPFAAEITDYYRNGVGWLAAIDVGAFSLVFEQEEELSRLLGISSMRYLFVEQRSGSAGDESAATLSFSGVREGMASWIAAPGGIGSAEYISPEVIAASAGSTRDPREAFDQLISLLGSESELMAGINELETKAGIDVRDDVAAALGTDFVLALEGVALGEPTWIGVLEVLNPGSLDEVVRRMVRAVNTEIESDHVEGEEPEFTLSFTDETVNGRTWKMLSGGSSTKALYWTYDRGYMVVSTDRGAATRAINVRDSASSLIRSSRFQQQFPSGTGVHNSGFMWLDLSRFADVLEALGREDLGLSNATAEPVLVVVAGDDSQIRWATRSRLTSLLFDLLLI